jgi:hypothetical protein
MMKQSIFVKAKLLRDKWSGVDEENTANGEHIADFCNSITELLAVIELADIREESYKESLEKSGQCTSNLLRHKMRLERELKIEKTNAKALLKGIRSIADPDSDNICPLCINSKGGEACEMYSMEECQYAKKAHKHFAFDYKRYGG